MFAAPMPIISWFGSTSSPRRAANADDVAIVSVSDTSVMPTAAISSGPTSFSSVHGSEGLGKPCGSVPTVAMRSDRSSTADTTVAATTATRTAGTVRVIRGRTRRITSTPTPDRERGPLGLVEVLEERADVVDEAVGVGGEPEQLRQLADDDRDREAVHVADLHLARQQVGDEAELADAEADLDEADDQGEHAGERDRGLRVVGGRERDDRREDQRRDRRVRPEHEHARRAEDRVAHEAPDRGVEPGDRRQPGELGVGHPLGDEDRREHETRDEVGSQPRPAVLARGAHAGHPPLDHFGTSISQHRGLRGWRRVRCLEVAACGSRSPTQPGWRAVARGAPPAAIGRAIRR